MLRPILGIASILFVAFAADQPVAAQERQLNGAEIRQLIAGRVLKWRSTCTYRGERSPEFELRIAVRDDGSYLWRCHVTANGRLCSDPSGRMSPGVWRIEGDALCTRSLTTNAERENCTQIYKVGAGYESRRLNHPCGRTSVALVVE